MNPQGLTTMREITYTVRHDPTAEHGYCWIVVKKLKYDSGQVHAEDFDAFKTQASAESAAEQYNAETS